MNGYRTHNCGELRKGNVGQCVKLAGWIDTIRDHGGVIFIDLRDHYGTTQIVVNDEDLINDAGRESIVTVEGILRERSADTVNNKLETGEVEVKAADIKLLSRPLITLPFEVGESTQTREELRLKYRFLDLRNPAVHKNIVMRADVVRFLRAEMERLGFVEIQTPVLTASSPEGARDYLVPSRKHKGMFYALPQAPQIFKQLLMVSGFDKYYQIAPCFRDEDARADRSPGEFYQLDFEMSFATQEDVFEAAETVLHNTFSKFSGKKVSPAPFLRIPYAESMLKYGTDKPDLRNPLIIGDLTDFFEGVDFAPFK
ncbi:MAG: aspartate--tRNA ligase, partial [Oscillospiraceae bacterium]|nr:aspartate--tRNA ligase [Oscillospiraceae bacterium]